MPESKATQVRLTQEERADLASLAARLDLTISDVIRLGLIELQHRLDDDRDAVKALLAEADQLLDRHVDVDGSPPDGFTVRDAIRFDLMRDAGEELPAGAAEALERVDALMGPFAGRVSALAPLLGPGAGRVSEQMSEHVLRAFGPARRAAEQMRSKPADVPE